MGKHDKGEGAPQEYSGDKDKMHEDIRALPTYKPSPATAYDKYTEKPTRSGRPS